MSYFYYFVYRTIIRSEIELLNLPLISATEEISAKICYADHASEYVPEGYLGTYYSPDCCALGTEWGTLEVKSGNLIQVYLKDQYTSHNAAPFIIGWGFAFLFQQRGNTIFHCSALELDGRGLIVSGVSGAGKSTTALSLLLAGAKYLADDMAVFDPDKGMKLYPSYPVQKVCRDVSIGLDAEKLQHINEGRDKFAYYNEADYCNHPVDATHLILLKVHDGDEVIASEVSGLAKWLRVLECMYLNELFLTFGTPEKDKQNCLRLAEKIKILEISRPRGKDTMQKITEIIREFVHS